MKKGLLKPLRYISNIFDSKERELQIGYPTDVKHVAHIGWDGPNMNTPSWMKDYHSAPLSSTQLDTDGRESPNLWASQEISYTGGLQDSPLQEARSHSRRPQSDGKVAVDSPSREQSKKGRRFRKKDRPIVPGDATAAKELPAIPKQSQRRRSKGSNRGSRLKDQSLPSIAVSVVANEEEGLGFF